jgi:hypothetical protein
MKTTVAFTAGLTLLALSGCASLTNDAFVPIAFSMSDGSEAECDMTNKRGQWTVEVPDTAMIRRSDDSLRYKCETEDGREAAGAIDSTVGAKIVASAVFIDFGITDAITDKHREYPASYVIPVKSDKTTSRSSKALPESSPRSAPAAVSTIAEAMMCTDGSTFDRADGDKAYWTLDCADGESLSVTCVQDTCYVR